MLFHSNTWPDMNAALMDYPDLKDMLKADLLVVSASWWKSAVFWEHARQILLAVVGAESWATQSGETSN